MKQQRKKVKELTEESEIYLKKMIKYREKKLHLVKRIEKVLAIDVAGDEHTPETIRTKKPTSKRD